MPHATLNRAGDVVTQLSAYAIQEQVQEIVLGLPLNMDGSESSASQRVRKLAAGLEKQSKIPVTLWDERLSTVNAQDSLHVMGIDSRKSKKVIDQVAASVILQGYLDSLESDEKAD